MKKSYIIGTIVVVVALVLAMFSFKSSLTSYVKINEAMMSEQHVQVAGILVKESVGYDLNNNLLIFRLRESVGNEMVVYYNKSKPANFENAEKIVAIGKYDKQKRAFIASDLLVKCPSKYEGRISEQ